MFFLINFLLKPVVMCLQESLISVLRRVLVPSILSYSQDISHAIISGEIYGRAIVCHPFTHFLPV